MQPSDTDLIIVGAGLAGLVCAARAQELGCRVIVVEAGDGEHYPCNSRYSGGVFHVAFAPATASENELRTAIESASRGYSRPALIEAMARDAGRAIDWLVTRGADFGEGGVPPWMNRMLQPFSLREPGFANHWSDKGMDRLLLRIGKDIAADGGAVLRRTRARALIVEDGRCIGISADTPEGPVTLRADAVVIADGGFSGNPMLMERHVTRDPTAICTRGAGTGMGDGMTMAAAIGAAVVGTDRCYGHVQCAEAREDDRLWPYPILDIVTSSAIAVDESGRRFVDEGLGGVPITNAILGLDDPSGAWVILDEAIWEGPGRAFLLPPNPTFEDRGVAIQRADTIAELADQIGMDATMLEGTVSTYDDALAHGTEGNLVPPRSRSLETLAALPHPVEVPPYIAIRLAAGVTYTMGGIAIDGNGRVLDERDIPIAGLYAAGAATGGLEGGARSTYVGGLMKALVFGMRAAEDIAEERGSATNRHRV